MLCDLVLQALVKALRAVGGGPGQGYVGLTVSIDPKDRRGTAELKQKTVLQALGYPEARAGWPFLVGAAAAQLADAVGFRYAYDQASGQYAHPAVAMVISPDGRVSRYLYGIAFRPLDLRLALAEASQGRVASTVDRVLLTCFRYDPATRRYGLLVASVVKGGSALVLLVTSVGLALLFRYDRRRQRGPLPAAAEGARPC
jgi:protein SCO1/2